MKVLVEETSGEGLEAFLGKPITLFCCNYFYTGVLVGINDTCVKIEAAKIVYETGSFSDSGWADAQALPWGEHYIQTAAIESFGGVK